MWIASTLGFFSIVVKSVSIGRPPVAMIRARERQALESLVRLLGERAATVRLSPDIIESGHTDYRFRVNVAPSDIGAIVGVLASTITYPNFKSAVGTAVRAGKVSAKYEHALHDVWHTMARTQSTPPYAGADLVDLSDDLEEIDEPSHAETVLRGGLPVGRVAAHVGRARRVSRALDKPVVVVGRQKRAK